MKIKVIKTILASQDPTGSKVFEYKAGEVYDIYQELAEVFISEGWGVAGEIEIETQEIVEEIETQEQEIQIETQEEKIEEQEIETQELEIKIETQDSPKKKKKNAN